MPRLERDVLAVSTALPVREAGEGVGFVEVVAELLPAVLDDDELLEDEVLEPPWAFCRTCCTICEIWLLTRFKAVLFAILDKPADKLA